MKALVVFYSRTGNTRKVGEEIARKLGAEREEIIDEKKRDGVIGFLTGGRDAFTKKKTKIKPIKKNPAFFDLVVIGTPVWAGKVSPAVRTYLAENKEGLKKVAFYCTMGYSSSSTFSEMKREAGKEPIALMEVKASEIKNACFSKKVAEFVKEILRK